MILKGREKKKKYSLRTSSTFKPLFVSTNASRSRCQVEGGWVGESHRWGWVDYDANLTCVVRALVTHKSKRTRADFPRDRPWLAQVKRGICCWRTAHSITVTSSWPALFKNRTWNVALVGGLGTGLGKCYFRVVTFRPLTGNDPVTGSEYACNTVHVPNNWTLCYCISLAFPFSVRSGNF